MSMWEIEGLGEIAVQLVASCEHLSPAERRTYYAGIYALQDSYDCSYTHFRCIKPLVRDGYIHHIPLEQHPAYGAQRAELEAVLASGNEWLPMDPSEAGSPIAGIYQERPSGAEGLVPGIYFDVTQPLWAVARGLGQVADLDGPPFEAWDDQTTILRVLGLAAERMESAPGEEARAVLKGFYGFAAIHFSYMCPPPAKDNLELKGLFARPILKTVLTEPSLDWIDERFPVPDYPKVDESGGFSSAIIELLRAPLDL